MHELDYVDVDKDIDSTRFFSSINAVSSCSPFSSLQRSRSFTALITLRPSD